MFARTTYLMLTGLILVALGRTAPAAGPADDEYRLHHDDVSIATDYEDHYYHPTVSSGSTELEYDSLSDSEDLSCGCDACGDDCCSGDRLLGIVAPTSPCYNDFISPMTNPVFFEDPRNLSELRFIFANHTLPPGLGRVQAYAMQIRASLNDRWSIVAAKDGFLVSENGVPAEDGWADVAAGLKYLLFADPCCGRLASIGASYELPVGSTRALQGNGDGEFHFYITGGTRFGNANHWLSATGFRIPSAPSEENSIWYWSNHFDHDFGCGWFGLIEVNWYHWMREGSQGGALTGLGGLDFYNFGATGVEGRNVVTGAFGIKYVPRDNMEIGVAWELPLTNEHDIIDNRLTADWIIRY